MKRQCNYVCAAGVLLAVASVGCVSSSDETSATNPEEIADLSPTQIRALSLDELLTLVDAGHAYAQFNLGIRYFDGSDDLPQDYSEAMRLWHLAAEQGDADAQYMLGRSYLGGEIVPRHYLLAHIWLNLAAAQGHSNAVDGREVAANKLNDDLIVEAQRLAREKSRPHPQ